MVKTHKDDASQMCQSRTCWFRNLECFDNNNKYFWCHLDTLLVLPLFANCLNLNITFNVTAGSRHAFVMIYLVKGRGALPRPESCSPACPMHGAAPSWDKILSVSLISLFKPGSTFGTVWMFNEDTPNGELKSLVTVLRGDLGLPQLWILFCTFDDWLWSILGRNANESLTQITSRCNNLDLVLGTNFRSKRKQKMKIKSGDFYSFSSVTKYWPNGSEISGPTLLKNVQKLII